jgi:GT2 family glycosyltransferase/ubiquinone/menaquinone biosynthesis C-methylase UbiE
MKFSGERFVPNETDYELAVEHLHRYYAILDLVKDKIVLDAASGEGYGTFILSQHARHVTGVDYSSEAVVHAKTTYANDNIKFVEASVEKLPVEDNSIDIVVSFETIEHVTEDIQHSFLREIKRVLKPDGILIMSTPDKYVYSDMNDFNNPFHKKEFYKDEFYKFLVNYFPNIELFVQKFEVSSFILNNKDKAAKNVQIDKNNLLRNAKYLVAICSEVVIKDININSFIPDSTNRLETLVRRIVTVQNEIEERNKHLKYLDQVIEEKNSIIENKDSKIKEIKQLLETETTKSKDNIKEIKYLLENEKTKNDINIKLIDMLNEEKQKLYSQVEFQNKNLNQALSTISGMEERFQEQNEKLVQALLKISEQEEEICKINEQLQANIEILDSYENLHDQMNNKIHEYNDHNNSIGNDNIEKDQIIKNQIGHINMLLEQERKLNNILQSGGWNALSKYYKIRDLILPDNSKRKLLAKLTFKTIKNPGKILSKINKKNIKKLNYYLKTENPELIADRVDNFIHRHSENENQSEFKVFNDIHTFEKLIFNKEALPQVSIIIPVYNQWNYTYACLKSILENTNSNISYEIIIADDMSTDQTININNYVENITIIRDGQNRGFLLNCNNAAKQAQGKYIFFLNNDTNVQTNWLRTLVELMENDESIGMAGSKLVYPDGRQQEAGGIIWNDASGWNYGRLDDPEKPEYNYVKEVDYISGAAIMIRSDLWKQIGGFDERYVPAYFEDSDLAFEIRNHGYKVVLQPKSVIIHFEGISHGTDVKSGVKSYQVKNKEKFIDKWQHILMKDHFNNADHVFFARDRSKNKKTILVIDHYIMIRMQGVAPFFNTFNCS